MTLEVAYSTRMNGREQRLLGNFQRNQIIRDLTDWLEIAALLLAKREGGVSPALQAHGFTVVEYTPPPNPMEAAANGVPYGASS